MSLPPHARPSRLAVLLGVVACGAPTGPAAGLDAIEVLPSASSFVRRPAGGAAVAFRVVNRGPTTVRLTSRCGDRVTPAVERREGGGWVAYAGGACPAIYDASPLPLAPGAERADTVGVGDAGEYRLVLGTEQAPVTSPAFRVD
jgi:hypothetical protein